MTKRNNLKNNRDRSVSVAAKPTTGNVGSSTGGGAGATGGSSSTNGNTTSSMNPISKRGKSVNTGVKKEMGGINKGTPA